MTAELRRAGSCKASIVRDRRSCSPISKETICSFRILRRVQKGRVVQGDRPQAGLRYTVPGGVSAQRAQAEDSAGLRTLPALQSLFLLPAGCTCPLLFPVPLGFRRRAFLLESRPWPSRSPPIYVSTPHPLAEVFSSGCWPGIVLPGAPRGPKPPTGSPAPVETLLTEAWWLHRGIPPRPVPCEQTPSLSVKLHRIFAGHCIKILNSPFLRHCTKICLRSKQRAGRGVIAIWSARKPQPSPSAPRPGRRARRRFRAGLRHSGFESRAPPD